MTLFWHELRQSRLSLIIWSAILAFTLSVSVLIYPEMKTQMDQFGDMFAEMGNFSNAFGMDQLNFSRFIDYFGLECGNSLGIGGALFAAITGILVLAKEEKDRTAEFLLTHPISRSRVITQKLLAVAAQIVILNVAVTAAVSLCILLIGEEVAIGTFALLMLSHLLLQLEIGAITCGISAFLKRNGMGIGLGLALLTYFLNIVANLSEDTEILKYVTPFAFTDSAYIIAEQALEWRYLAVGAVLTVLGIIAAYRRYTTKDIA